jgi:hypothetical protein
MKFRDVATLLVRASAFTLLSPRSTVAFISLCVVHHTRSSAVNAALTNGPAIAISALWRFGDKHLKVHCAPVHVPVHDAVLNILVLTSRVRCRTSTSKMSLWAAVFAHWRFRSRARAAMLQV